MDETLEASRQLLERLPDSAKKRELDGTVRELDQLTTRIKLMNRMLVAAKSAYGGDLPGALRLFAELLADQERELGRDDEFTLKTRSAIGFATHQSGDARQALRLSAELLSDQERVLGPRSCRYAGDAREDCALYQRSGRRT